MSSHARGDGVKSSGCRDYASRCSERRQHGSANRANANYSSRDVVPRALRDELPCMLLQLCSVVFDYCNIIGHF